MTDEPGILAITPASCMAALTSQSSPASAGRRGVGGMLGRGGLAELLVQAGDAVAGGVELAVAKGRARSSVRGRLRW